MKHNGRTMSGASLNSTASVNTVASSSSHMSQTSAIATGTSPPNRDPRQAGRINQHDLPYKLLVSQSGGTLALPPEPPQLPDGAPQYGRSPDDYFEFTPSGVGGSPGTSTPLGASPPSDRDDTGSLASLLRRTPDAPRKTVMVQLPSSKKLEPPKKSNSAKKQKVPDATKDVQACKEAGDSVLDLSGKSLVTIPTTIKDLGHHVRELYLYDNKLTNLPAEIGCLVQLEKLMLQQNWLTGLPDGLIRCKRLRTLDLRHNRLENRIPPVIYRLESLTQLFLMYNKITEVEAGLGLLTRTQFCVSRPIFKW